MRNTHWRTSHFLFVVLISGVLLTLGVGRAAPNEGPPVNEPAPAAVEPAPEPAVEPPTLQEEPGPPAEVGDIQERAVPRKLPSSATAAPPPAGMAPPPGIVGPTENITKVARAIQVRAKSLTTVVVVAPGLVLTQPVTISVVLGGYCPNPIMQSYASTA